jgi:hypothetical protein
MKKRLNYALIIAIVASLLFTGLSYAQSYIHIGPYNTLGSISVSTSSYITTGSSSFLTQGNSTAGSAISRIGGITFASREWCGGSIRNSANHGGWAAYSTSSASINGGLTWGARCTDQSASTAAQHDFSNGGQTWQPYFYSPQDQRP